CNVAGAVLAMALEPASLNFKPQATAAKGFVISGGTKPYSVRWLDAAPAALTISFDGGFGDTAQVKLGAGEIRPDTYRLVVSDASNPRHSEQMAVVVVDGAAPAAAAPVAAAAAASAAAVPPVAPKKS
ncbi:hypothetical protein ACVBEH_27375, partial [Roseateles sp. GG27B]